METNVTSSDMFSSPKAKCAVHARAVNDTQSQIFQEKKQSLALQLFQLGNEKRYYDGHESKNDRHAQNHYQLWQEITKTVQYRGGVPDAKKLLPTRKQVCSSTRAPCRREHRAIGHSDFRKIFFSTLVTCIPM